MNKFWIALKYFGISVTAATAIGGTVLFFAGMKNEIVEVKETVDHINIEQGWMAEDIQSIRDTITQFEKEHRKQGKDIETLRWGLEQHENFTPEQFEEIMNELLKKNFSQNPSPSSETPFGMTISETMKENLNLSQ